MATEKQTKLVGFCLGDKTNYNATNYANHIWFDPTNKQILLNGIEYIPKKLSELVNDNNFLTSITKAMVEGVLTGNITSHTHSYLPLTGEGASGTWDISISGNAATASKLGDATVGALNQPVYFKSGAATAVSAIKESLLTYGIDSNFNGTISPIDMAISNIHSANRIAFGNPDGVTIEYSTDGGVNWAAYGATDEQKTNLISGLGTVLYIGGPDTSNAVSTRLMLRITLNAINLGTYTRPRKALIYVTTFGATSCTVTVEAATLGNQMAFSTIGTYAIDGNSGWNSIPLGSKNTFGGFSGQTSNNGVFRFTFGIGAVGSSGDSRLRINDIAIYGETYWTTPSNMAKTGHIYSYDALQNVTFPKKVTASSFVLAAANNISGIGTDIGIFGKDVNILLNDSENRLNLNDLFNSFAVTIGGGSSSIFGHINNLKNGLSSLTSDVSALQSVATAESNGLMSAAMFKAAVVRSVGVRQGAAGVIGGGSITDHSVYISHRTSNLSGDYLAATGTSDVKIPNATKDYDGSMSYTDKIKLDNLLFVINLQNVAYKDLLTTTISTADIDGFSDIFNSSTQPDMVRVNLSDTAFVCTLYSTDFSTYFYYYNSFNQFQVKITTTNINFTRML